MSKDENSTLKCSIKFSSIARDESGTVAVEFAILAPLMVVLMVGIIDLGTMLMKYRHAVQAAASLAQVGAHLSIENRDASKGVANTITPEQSDMLNNGLKMVFGKTDTKNVTALARRVIRTGNELKTDWAWSKGNIGKNGSAYPLNEQKILTQTVPGESLMVIDVSFSHRFLFASFFGKDSVLTAHYSAGVPSY